MISCCCCSFCGRNGHSSQSCGEFSSSVTGGGGGEIMLFGVRLKLDPMRKCMSMNNLSQYENPHDSAADNAASVGVDTVATCYASADEAVNRQSSGGRERKRGVPWTKEEHKLFLLGLQKAGKGDWRGISRNFVKSRTPTQIASHAQKYFLRKNNLTRRGQRSSLFDMPSDLVTVIPMEEEQICLDKKKQPVLSSQPLLMTQSSSIHGFPSESVTFGGSPVADFTTVVSPISLPVHIENPTKHLTLGKNDQVNNASTVLVCSVPVLPVHSASTAAKLSLDQRSPIDPSSLSLKLPLSSDQNQPSSSLSSLPVISSFNNGDIIICVT